MAIQNENRLIERLQAVIEIAAAINKSLDLDDVLDLILENAGRFVPHDAANILLIKGDEAQVMRAKSLIAERHVSHSLIEVLKIPDYPLLKSLVDSVKPLIIEDTSGNAEWVKRPETAWVRSLLGVPIKFQDQLLGIITLESKSPGTFTADHVDDLQAFVDQAGIAIQNARLYTEVQRYATHLESRIAKHTAELQAANLVLRSQVNDRIRIEQALRESEEKYRTLYTAMNEGVALHELVLDDNRHPVDYRIIDVNPAYEAILGFPRGEAVGKLASELYGTGAPPLLDTFADVVSTGNPTSFDLYFPPMNKHFSISAFSPGPGQFATIFTDITESKRAEEALRESEIRYRGLFDGNPLGLYRTTLSGQFLDVNDALVKILGYPNREQLLRVNAHDMYYEPRIRDEVIEQSYRDSRLDDFEVQFRHYSGRPIWISDTARVIFDAEGKIAYFEGAIQDISARKQTEEEVKLYTEIIERANIGLTVWELGSSPGQDALRLVVANQAAQAVHQRHTALMEDKTEEIQFYLELGTGGLEGITEAIRTGKPIEYEENWLDIDGLPDSAFAIRVFPLTPTRAGVAFEDITARKLAERAERDQRDLAEGLRDVIAALNSTLDFDEVLGRILTNVERVVPHNWADVMLIEGNIARIVRSRNMQEGLMTSPILAWPLDETPNLAWMFESGKTLAIPDTYAYPGWRLEPGTEWIRSFVGAPILFGDQVMGFINIASSQPEFYSEDHGRRLQAFADQAAIALRNARLYEFIHRRQRYLETLHRVSRRAVPEHDQKSLMQAVVEGLAAGFDYQIVGILTVDEERGVLQQAAAAGSHSLVKQIGLTYSQPVDSGIMGWVVKNNQPRMVNDTHNEPDYRRPERGLDSRSMLAAPIRHRGKVIGVLNVLSAHKNAFDELDQETLLELAEDLGLYIENLTLNEQAKVAATLAERNRLARDLHDSVTQSLYSLTLFTEAARQHALSGSSEQVAQHLERIARIGQQALKEMRLLVYELRPEALEREGLVGALRRRLEAVERRAGIDARLVADQLIDLPLHIEQELYRITQEALNNALKHAEATEIRIHLGIASNQLTLEVIDNGIGFSLEEARDGGGMGLVSMNERAQNINGTLNITSEPGQGTTVGFRVDISEEISVF